MVAPDTTVTDFPEAMKADSYEMFWERYDSLPKVFDRIYNVKKTDRLYDKSTSAVGSGLLEEKTETGNLAEKKPIQGFTVFSKVREWGKIMSISRSIKDDTMKLGNFLKDQMPTIGTEVNETMETFYALPFNKGFLLAGHTVFNGSVDGLTDAQDPSGDKLYDSTVLFNLANNLRASKGGGQYYNGHARPFSISNLKFVYTHMTVNNNRKENDTLMRMVPDQIIASPNLKFDIDPVLSSQGDPSTSNRSDNPVQNLVDKIYWDYLDDTNQWSLMKVKTDMVEALIRQEPEFDIFEDKKSKGWFLSVYLRFGFSWKNWRVITSSNGTTV